MVCPTREFSLNEWPSSYWVFFSFLILLLFSILFPSVTLPTLRKAFQFKEIYWRILALSTGSGTNDTLHGTLYVKREMQSTESSSTWRVGGCCVHVTTQFWLYLPTSIGLLFKLWQHFHNRNKSWMPMRFVDAIPWEHLPAEESPKTVPLRKRVDCVLCFSQYSKLSPSKWLTRWSL